MTDQGDRVTIHTDGSCLSNPGPGGWAAILRWRDNEREIVGHEPDTTNNRMELLAPIEALNSLTEACNVELTTDSLHPGWVDTSLRSSLNHQGPQKTVENLCLLNP